MSPLSDRPRPSGQPLSDYGVVLSDDSDREALEWRFSVDGPLLLMTSATGVDARGFRYLAGVWPERNEFISISLVKLYATGGREGVIGIIDTGPELDPIVARFDEIGRVMRESENFVAEYEPTGSLPGWGPLDDAAVRGYGGTRPPTWPPPGEPCVMRYRRDPPWMR